MTREPQPDWSRSHSWDEFEWETAFKYSDHMTSKYFRMLSRFGDLPDAERFIAEELGDQNLFVIDEEETWFPDDGDWDLDDPLDEDSFGETPGPIEPGDPLFYETHPLFIHSRQVALGWCNVLASVLQPEDRFWGLRVLFHYGRMLQYLAMSIGDGMFDRLNGSIAFAKRVLDQINKLLGKINELEQESKQYAPMFNLFRERLLDIHDHSVDYLEELRKRQRGEIGTDADDDNGDEA